MGIAAALVAHSMMLPLKMCKATSNQQEPFKNSHGIGNGNTEIEHRNSHSNGTMT